jgi:hypothetical protein
MSDRNVAINFCGGCNPVINRKNLALEIKSVLVAEGFRVTFNDWDAGFIVHLSGCAANCALRFHPTVHLNVVVAGRSFNATAVDEVSLADHVVTAARARFQTLPDDALPPLRRSVGQGIGPVLTQ